MLIFAKIVPELPDPVLSGGWGGWGGMGGIRLYWIVLDDSRDMLKEHVQYRSFEKRIQ